MIPVGNVMSTVVRFPRMQAARALIALFAIMVAACSQPAYQSYYVPAARVGTVESIRQVQKQAAPTGAAAVIGGVSGGLLGSLVGGGTGRTAAIVVGAVGGGIVGHEVEKNRTDLVWEIGVRYDDGGTGVITQPQAPGLRIGDRISVTDTGFQLLPR